MITIKITNTKQIVTEKKGWLVANLVGAVVDMEAQVEAIVVERLRASLASEGVEAIIAQVAASSTSCKYTFASSGEITPPCGVPVSGWRTTPFSITPAFSHLPINRSNAPSLTRWLSTSRSLVWSTESKNFSMSASNTQPPPSAIVSLHNA